MRKSFLVLVGTAANAGADAASLLAQTAEQPVTFETAKALTSKGDHDAAIDACACLCRVRRACAGEARGSNSPRCMRPSRSICCALAAAPAATAAAATCATSGSAAGRAPMAA
mgnify:CR=1 FL=1